MLKFYVDFNAREVSPWGQSVALVGAGENVSCPYLRQGEHVLVYDEDIECEAVVRPGKLYLWVADLIENTIKMPAEV